MCESCQARAVKLRDLAHQFEALARDGEPLFATRLRQAATDLAAVAASLELSCGAEDLVWADDETDAGAAPDLFARTGT